MKKYLLIIVAIFISYSLGAQCLGDDCSIKGRNEARQKKTAKMTGKRGGSGALYSIGGGKKKKRKAGSSQGFDPFAGGSEKGGGAGGYDPFAEYDKKNKKNKKGGAGYDPFATNDKKSKYKGRTASGGYDPFDDKSSKYKGRNSSGGYDPFADNSKSKRRGKDVGGTWTASDGKRKLKVDYSSPYSDWDGSSRSSARGGRGRANDSWLEGSSSASAKVNKGGGNWNENSSAKSRSGGKANDSWVAGNDKKGVGKGGGTWADGSNAKSRKGRGAPNDSWGKGGGGSVNSEGAIWAQGGNAPNTNRANKYENGSNNWENVDLAAVTAPPIYERVDNTPKSYSDYEGAGASSDLIYDNPHQYKYNLIGGNIYQHESKISTYLSGVSLRPILGAEFCVEWPTVGSKNWHHYYNVPTTGLGFTYLNLGHEALLGSAFAIYPYVDIPLLSTDPVDFNLSAGFGVSCVTKWNKQSLSNTDSIPGYEIMPMFSSPINVYFKGGFNIAFRPFTNITNAQQDAWSHYTFTLGAYMMHISNGNFASPNYGLNMLSAELGMKYCPSVLTPVVRKSGETLPRYLSLDFMGSAFMREMNRLDTKKYTVGNFNVALYYQVANIYRLGLGVDAFYDDAFGDSHFDSKTTSKYADFYNYRYDPSKFEQRIRGGGCLSNEFVIGRVTAALDGGYYFYDNIKAVDENFYFRFAMKYRVTSGLFGVVAIKTHMLNAEFITFGLGYSILL